MNRFLSVILIPIMILSMICFVYEIALRIQRNDWVITTAEITFVGLPDGTVFGTFRDSDGIVHADRILYRDVKFQPKFILSGGPMVNPEPYIGTTVRIMYNPDWLSMGHIGLDGIDSYDNWLNTCIGSGVCFGLSLFFLILLFRKRKAQKRLAMEFVKNHRLFGNGKTTK